MGKAIWHKNVRTTALLAAIKGFKMLTKMLETRWWRGSSGALEKNQVGGRGRRLFMREPHWHKKGQRSFFYIFDSTTVTNVIWILLQHCALSEHDSSKRLSRKSIYVSLVSSYAMLLVENLIFPIVLGLTFNYDSKVELRSVVIFDED